MDGHTILRTQPGRHTGDLALGDLLFPKADSPVLIARASPPGSPGVDEQQPFRFGRWLVALQAAVGLGGQRAPQIGAPLPFSRWPYTPRDAAEPLFSGLIAGLHAAQLFGGVGDDQAAADPAPGQSARGPTAPTSLLATNGEALFAYRATMPLYFCTFAGIAACAPCRLGDGYKRLARVVDEHESFRGVCVSSRPFETEERWQEIPMRNVLVVGLDASTHLVALSG